MKRVYFGTICLLIIFSWIPANMKSQDLIKVDFKSIKSKLENRNVNIALPIAENTILNFTAKEIKLMSTEFSLQFPDIKTYRLLGQNGMKGTMTMNKDKIWYTIDIENFPISVFPVEESYFIANITNSNKKTGPSCKVDKNTDSHFNSTVKGNPLSNLRNENFPKRTYRLAIVCTGEYYQANGNNDADVNASIVAGVNGIQDIYHNDLSINFDLLTPRLYNNPNTDPFEPDMNGGDDRTTQAAINVNANFNSSAYDIGHVFHTHQDDDGWSNGGVASLGVVCNSNMFGGAPLKARGWSGAYQNTTYSWHSLAAHEIAHMFSATHTFNGTGESCTDAIADDTAYEIGSGNTIMSYNNLCDETQNTPNYGPFDNYFHIGSIMQILNYESSISSCAVITDVNNTTPDVFTDDCGSTFVIPKNTPFLLKGRATDEENNNLTYTWEQFNEDGVGVHPTQGFIGTSAANSPTSPNFRCFPPTSDNFRYFPDLKTVIEGSNTDLFQALPRRPKTLKFQLTARDNNIDGGAIATSSLDIEIEDGGPLFISFPNGNNTLQAGETYNFTWNLAGSDFLCDKVEIRLSTDGGNTFPILLAEDIDYTATNADILIPPIYGTDQARVMVMCDDNECVRFFDISNLDFTIESACLAQENFICPDDDFSFEKGDPGLNLGLNTIVGSKVTEMSKKIFSNDPKESFIVTYNVSGDNCALTQGFNYNYKIDRFTVSEEGSYLFILDLFYLNGQGLITLFDGDNFTMNDPCSSFIGSTITQLPNGSITFTSVLNAFLEPCKEYVMVYYNTEPPSKTTLIQNILGPGDIILHPTNPDSDFESTIIAVKEPDQIVTGISQSGDFTNLNGGEYKLYSVNYKNSGIEPPANANPNDWLGMNLNDILFSGSCFYLTGSPSMLEIISDCSIEANLGTQSQCDPLTNTFSQEIIITFDELPPDGMLSVNGILYPMSTSPYSIVLENIDADGLSRDLEIYFTEDLDCVYNQFGFFTAPENCCPFSLDLESQEFIICEGEVLSLDNDDETLSYEWYFENTLVSESSIFEATEDGEYMVIATNDNDCKRSFEFSLIVNPNPILNISGPQALCDGEAIILTAETNENTVTWKKDGVELSETGIDLTVTETGLYSAEVSNIFNCQVTQQLDIEVHPRPIVDLGQDIVECNGIEVLLTANSPGTNTYEWKLNGMIIPGDNQILSVLESGIYEVVVSNEFNCSKTDEINVEFIDSPSIDAGQDIIVCEGNPAIIDATTDGNYVWFKDGQMISESNLSFTATEGEYVLISTNIANCESRDTILVTILPLPQVSLGEDKIACIGSTVILEGPVGDFEYNWILNGVSISQDQSIEIDQNGNYSLMVTNLGNCTAEDQILVEFVPGPSLDLGMDITECEDMLYTINAQTNANNIEWFLNGVLLSDETDFSLLSETSGVYGASVIGNSGCKAEDEIIITYNPLPIVDLGPDRNDCEGEVIEISYNDNATSIIWTDESGVEISTDNSISIQETGIYSIEVTNEFNCKNSDNINIEFFPLPIVELDDNYDLCEGSTIVVNATSDASTFEWYLNNQILNGENSSSVELGQGGTIKIIAISQNNCKSETESEITIRAIPEVNLGPDTDLCPNDGILLSTTGSQILWNTGAMVSGVQVNSPNLNSLSSEKFSVTVTNSFGCQNSDEITITYLPVVTASVIGDLNGICEGETMFLTASGGTNYTWNDPANALINIDGNIAEAKPTETTTVSVTVSDDCPENEDIAEIEVKVFSPSPNISAGKDTCVILGRSIELQASGGVDYEWIDDSSISSSLQISNPTVSPEVETTYYVDIFDLNGCMYRDSVKVCVIEDPLSIFVPVTLISPNNDGQNDVLNFLGLESFPDNKLKIYNRWGNLLYEKIGYQTNSERFDGTENGIPLPEGTYYYILEFEGYTFKKALTIIKD